MYYTRITLFCATVVTISFLNGINCIDKENVLAIQPWVGIGQSSLGHVSSRDINTNGASRPMQPILNPSSPIITPRKDGKIGRTKGPAVVFTLKKHPKIVLLREVRRPPKQLNGPKKPLHQRRGKQPTNVAVFNQQRAIEQQKIRQQQAEQERLREQQAQQSFLFEQQAQQQRFIENQAQQQTIYAQNAFQTQQFPIPAESQSFIDQRIRNEQHAQRESLRQQAFLDGVAEQERQSYLQKKRRKQNRPRRFPDGLIDPERLRNQKIMMRERQRPLALQQTQLNGFADQQSFIAQQQSHFQTQQPQAQQLSGAASQQQNWIYHPQALDNANALQQLSEEEKRHLQPSQQQAFRNERPIPSLRRIPKQPKQRKTLGRKFVLRIIAKE
uniref:Uncharacterized protein n=1 Tax=Anopheles funestus TaxID=62324 RepID=A0A4Y0BEP9_ANOFN